ncbi:MAG: hypothetical protein WC823_07520 [Parcubacteria group bacterium]|jgi:ACR3 family arsenite efflux pump ArsB
MLKFLDHIQKYLFWWIAGVIASGLAVVYLWGGYPFSSTICVVAALVMIYPSLVPLAFDKLPASLKQHYRIILLSVFMNFVILPALAYLIGAMFLEQEPVLRLGLILLALLPGGGMVTTWAMKSEADMPTTIGIVLTNLLVAIVAVPFGVSFFINFFSLEQVKKASAAAVCTLGQATGGWLSCGLGTGTVSPLKIAVPILIVVIIPLVMAYLTQEIIKSNKDEAYFEKVKIIFGKLSNLGLLIVLFILMTLKNNRVIFDNPRILVDIFVPLILLYLTAFGLIFLLYRTFRNKAVGRAFVWGSYLRYITLALGMAISLVFQDERLAMLTTVIVLAYFIQIPSSFLLVKILKKY